MVDVDLPPDFHLGILAPEYPPEVGGMQELARGLAMSLSKLVEVSVFTKQDSDRSDASGQKRAVLTLDLETDAALLEESKVDAWLAMSSGLIPIGESLSLPFFTYAHGNGFS